MSVLGPSFGREAPLERPGGPVSSGAVSKPVLSPVEGGARWVPTFWESLSAEAVGAGGLECFRFATALARAGGQEQTTRTGVGGIYYLQAHGWVGSQVGSAVGQVTLDVGAGQSPPQVFVVESSPHGGLTGAHWQVGLPATG